MNSVTGVPRSFVLTLAIGITFGFSFAYMLINISSRSASTEYFIQRPVSGGGVGGGSGTERTDKPPLPNRRVVYSHDDMADEAGPEKEVVFHQHPGTSLADEMYKNVRVLCWVMTSPENHVKKAKHVKATWGRRCNRLLFMSTKTDAKLPEAVALNVSEGRNTLWGKTQKAFKYVYEHHLEEADWFMKADDDTYVIVENLRFMLQPHSPADPVYFGLRFKVYGGYMSGGAGYVLSKEALRRFVEVGINKQARASRGLNCKTNTDVGTEDVEMGSCMRALKVEAGDSRDAEGRGRFFPFVPESHLIPGHVPRDFWYWRWIHYPSSEGMGCCSDSAVSFHYVSPNQMYVMEYLLYHLRPYGIDSEARLLQTAGRHSQVTQEEERETGRETGNQTKTIEGQQQQGKVATSDSGFAESQQVGNSKKETTSEKVP